MFRSFLFLWYVFYLGRDGLAEYLLISYLGRYGEAIDYCQHALTLYQTLSGENDYSTIAASNNLALLYLLSERLSEAERLLQKTLAILVYRADLALAKATLLNNLAYL